MILQADEIRIISWPNLQGPGPHLHLDWSLPHLLRIFHKIVQVAKLNLCHHANCSLNAEDTLTLCFSCSHSKPQWKFSSNLRQMNIKCKNDNSRILGARQKRIFHTKDNNWTQLVMQVIKMKATMGSH